MLQLPFVLARIFSPDSYKCSYCLNCFASTCRIRGQESLIIALALDDGENRRYGIGVDGGFGGSALA